MTVAPGADLSHAVPSTRQRALHLLAACWRINVAEELQYRGNFIASLLGTTFWMSTALLTVALFFSQTTQLGGWGLGMSLCCWVCSTLAHRRALSRPCCAPASGNWPTMWERRAGSGVGPSRRCATYTSVRRLDIWRLADIVLGFALAGYALVRIRPAGRGRDYCELCAHARLRP